MRGPRWPSARPVGVPPARRLRQFLVAAILALYPVWFMLSTAFKSNDQYLDDPYGLPVAARRRRTSATRCAAASSSRWLKNSAILSVGSVVMATAFAALAAFAIAGCACAGAMRSCRSTSRC